MFECLAFCKTFYLTFANNRSWWCDSSNQLACTAEDHKVLWWTINKHVSNHTFPICFSCFCKLINICEWKQCPYQFVSCFRKAMFRFRFRKAMWTDNVVVVVSMWFRCRRCFDNVVVVVSMWMKAMSFPICYIPDDGCTGGQRLFVISVNSTSHAVVNVWERLHSWRWLHWWTASLAVSFIKSGRVPRDFITIPKRNIKIFFVFFVISDFSFSIKSLRSLVASCHLFTATSNTDT